MAGVIDLYPCGLSADGVPAYGSPLQALGHQCGQLICEHPSETLHLLLLAVIGVCVYLAIRVA